jgi:hypothetical protein
MDDYMGNIQMFYFEMGTIARLPDCGETLQPRNIQYCPGG